MPSNCIKTMPMITVDSSGLTAYTALNGLGYSRPINWIRIVNESKADLLISYDGSTDNDIVLTKTQYIIYPQPSAVPNNKVALFPANTIIYGQATSDTGYIYLIAYYL